MLGKLGIGGKDKGDKAKHGGFEIGKVVHFSDKTENHELWIEEKGNSLEIMVASYDPSPVIRRLKEWNKERQNNQRRKNR
ncbi:hypothetical protein [Chryseobacterium sp.]|uniref:hypothetical protein n=1 Tax=Chryseobacterium sp. TaxID=1871047 RepID=UPI00321A1364